MIQIALDATVASHMLCTVSEKIAEIEAGEYVLRYDEMPGSATTTYNVGFALNRFEKVGSARSTQDAFDALDAEKVHVCQVIRRERGLPPIQCGQSHDRHCLGYAGVHHGGK